MATKKKPAAKKAPAKKPAVKKSSTKKAPVKKSSAKSATVRSAAVSRRQFITRTDEYTQMTWILVSIWLILIAIFLGAVVGQMG
jgi:hypothetical protein